MVSESITLYGTLRVDAPVDVAFPLFSPRGEEAWVPEWKPELIHPPGVDWCEGQVFRTVHDGQESIWFVARLDRDSHEVTYHRVDLGLSATSVTVRCRPAGENATETAVEYRWVGLTGEGNRFVREQTREAFREKLTRWEAWISAALAATR